jgi:hypothetical protein
MVDDEHPTISSMIATMPGILRGICNAMGSSCDTISCRFL